VFIIEHLHTIARFFEPANYSLITHRWHTHATQSRRNALHKSLITQHLLSQHPDLQYTFCNLPSTEYQIDTFEHDLPTILAVACTEQELQGVKHLHANPKILPGNDWDITEIYTTSKLFWSTESVFLTRDNAPTAYLTEKTFKPIVTGSVWVVCGQKNSYQRIRELGFETFEDQFQIDYDHLTDQERIAHIYSLIDSCDFDQVLNNANTQSIVDYNYNHFFNHLVEHVEKENTPKIQTFIDYVNNL
jgi:hypothetical protein